MEVNETVSIFQNLAYPVAVSVILFLCAIWFGRKMLEEMRTVVPDAAIVGYVTQKEDADIVLE